MNKKFKLIKQYPDSNLKVGAILEFPEGVVSIIQRTDKNEKEYYEYEYLLSECRDFPEFWQEIIEERDYIGVCFKTQSGMYYKIFLKKNSYYYLSWGTNKGDIPYSRKEIEDAFKCYWIEIPLEEYEKQFRQKICTSNDRIDLYDGDSYWYIHDDINNSIHEGTIYSGQLLACNTSRFSTKQKAEEYIRGNKVLFVTKDNVDIKEGDIYYVVDNYYTISYPYKANSNLPKYYHGLICYKDKEKAKEYIQQNKPLFSWKQIEDACVNTCMYNVLYPQMIKPALEKQLEQKKK